MMAQVVESLAHLIGELKEKPKCIRIELSYRSFQ